MITTAQPGGDSEHPEQVCADHPEDVRAGSPVGSPHPPAEAATEGNGYIYFIILVFLSSVFAVLFMTSIALISALNLKATSLISSLSSLSLRYYNVLKSQQHFFLHQF